MFWIFSPISTTLTPALYQSGDVTSTAVVKEVDMGSQTDRTKSVTNPRVNTLAIALPPHPLGTRKFNTHIPMLDYYIIPCDSSRCPTPGNLDRVFCPKICLFKTDGWHFGTEFLATQKTSISENYCHFKL